MNLSERFQRFAAECEVMAKFTPDLENQLVWRRMAERWIRCAELSEGQVSTALKGACGAKEEVESAQPPLQGRHPRGICAPRVVSKCGGDCRLIPTL